MLLALSISAVLTQVLSRSGLAARWAVIRAGFSPRIALLTAALMVFKRVLETSGALDAVAGVVDPSGVSGYVLLFTAPFLVALLTGVNQAFVAITFPLLVPIVGAGTPDPFLALFAYVSGFTGILISPAHLCLALTADYFKADLRDVYRILAGPVAVVFGAALTILVGLRLLYAGVSNSAYGWFKEGKDGLILGAKHRPPFHAAFSYHVQDKGDFKELTVIDRTLSLAEEINEDPVHRQPGGLAFSRPEQFIFGGFFTAKELHPEPIPVARRAAGHHLEGAAHGSDIGIRAIAEKNNERVSDDNPFLVQRQVMGLDFLDSRT